VIVLLANFIESFNYLHVVGVKSVVVMMVPLAVTFSSSMVQVHVALMITDIVLFLTVISDRNTAFRMEYLLLNDLFASSRVCAHTKHIFVQL